MKKNESGFALLLVFAMAATIALLLYMEMPRVAFERQRDQEALLIARGEQYKRAIQLYFRKFKTYPTSIDSLENTNNIRFLRRRYADPLTGKDDWRLIHIGPGGVFTDSVTNKPKGDQQTQNQNNFITEGPSLSGGTSTDQPSGPAFRRRPSEGGQPQAGADPNAQQLVTGFQPGTNLPLDSGNTQDQAAQLGLGQNPAQPTVPGQGQQLGGPGTPGAPPSPVSAFPGIPGIPGNPGVQQPGGIPTDPNAPGTAPGTGPGSPNPYGQPGANPAADLIRNLLTQPRAMPGSQPTAAGGSQISAGSIAGVASKVERRGIKIYNERDKYNEWEFIYDFSKDRTGAGQLATMMGQPQQGGQPQPGQQPTSIPGFGGQSGSSGAFGFGSPTPQQQPSMPGMQAGPLPPTSGTPPQ